MTTDSLPQQPASLTIDQALQQAVAHHQAGQLQDAERLYRAILQTQPNHPDANHNLGVIAVQLKQPATALLHFKTALDANPNVGQYWLSYIDALIQTDQTDTARQVLERERQRIIKGETLEALAWRLKPSSQEIETLVTLFGEDRYAEVASLAQTMTVRFPLHEFGWKALGAALMQMGQSADALIPMQTAAKLSPGDAAAQSNLGAIFHDLGRFNEAESSCRKALEIWPDYADAYANLGNTFRYLGQLDQAEACCRRALEIVPDLAVAHNNLGNTLHDQGRLVEAEVSYRHALQIKPAYAEAQLSLGHLLCDLNNLVGATVAYKKTFNTDPADSGLVAAVYLALLNYLSNNPEQCRNMLLASQPILVKTGRKYNNSRVYWRYLDQLLSWHRQFSQKNHQTQDIGTLRVIGESHSLSAHGVVVRYKQQEMLCVAEWIPGCKQWHLGNSKANKYKNRFEAVMERLPHNSTILLFIGEIDCRYDEGILKALKKYSNRTLADLVQSTVDPYVNYVHEISFRYGHKIIVGGVPSTNIQFNELAAAATEQFVNLIQTFNTRLRSQALSAGMDFLDLYALTDRGDGISSGECHLDDYHLLPSALVEAFDRYCLQPKRDNLPDDFHS